ncbi:hypothetical protein [Rhodoferax sp.]|uniref:hypothetical protein n=1 Tax=Rhodoferax sp. TaxID=50421 RepID=UPI0025D22267|nr:hypothetical protein [Rhodoferax sp.]
MVDTTVIILGRTRFILTNFVLDLLRFITPGAIFKARNQNPNHPRQRLFSSLKQEHSKPGISAKPLPNKVLRISTFVRRLQSLNWDRATTWVAMSGKNGYETT